MSWVRQNQYPGGIATVGDTSSIASEDGALSWSSGETSFKRLRMTCTTPPSCCSYSSLSDVVFIDRPQQQQRHEQEDKNYQSFNQYLGQLHNERINRMKHQKINMHLQQLHLQQQLHRAPSSNNLTPQTSNLTKEQQHHHVHSQGDSLSTVTGYSTITDGSRSMAGWSLLQTDSQLY